LMDQIVGGLDLLNRGKEHARADSQVARRGPIERPRKLLHRSACLPADRLPKTAVRGWNQFHDRSRVRFSHPIQFCLHRCLLGAQRAQSYIRHLHQGSITALYHRSSRKRQDYHSQIAPHQEQNSYALQPSVTLCTPPSPTILAYSQLNR
jgi:hypothetical protein